MSNKIDYYLMGKNDYYAWSRSQQFSQFNQNTPPEIIMKLFLPPIPQDMMQISRPLPFIYQEWLRGFEEERINNFKPH